MAKELLLYGYVSVENVKEVIQGMDLEETPADGYAMRINTDGGDPEAYGGLIAKMAQVGPIKIKVDNKAYSAGAIAVLYGEEVECLDISNFMFHRAGYDEWMESSEYFTEEIRSNMESVNANCWKAMQNKLDIPALQAIMDSREHLGGAKAKDIFSMNSRFDVYLTAQEAKKVGLVDRIIKITPQKQAEIASKMALKKAAFYKPTLQQHEQTKFSDMTYQELKEKHPATYAQILAEGKQAGALEGKEQEKQRAEAILAFKDVDMDACVKAIESGLPMNQKQINEMLLKAQTKAAVASLKKDSEQDIATGETEDEAEEQPKPGKPKEAAKKTQVMEFEKAARARLGLKN